MNDAVNPTWPAPPAGGAGWLRAYLGCIGIALAVGFLYDRTGALRSVLAIGGIVVLLLGLRDFRILGAAVVFLLPFVPTYFLSQGVAGISGQRILGAVIVLALISLACALVLAPGRIRLPAWRPVCLAYVALFVFAALNGARFAPDTPDYFKALGVVTDTTAMAYLQVILFAPSLVLAACAVMALVALNARHPGWILAPLFASAAVLALLVCWFATHADVTVTELGQQDARRALSALGLHANELGLLLNMALAPALCALGATRRLAPRITLMLLSLILMAGVLMTFSRGAFLGLGVVFLYALFSGRGRNWPIYLLLALALVVALSSQSVVQRATQGIGGEDVDMISSGRVNEIWRPLLPEVLQHPVIGNGHAAILWSDAARSRAILPVGHPHSAYLGSLLDVGIAGTLLTALFFGHMWRMFGSAARRAGSAALGGFFRGAAACLPLLLVQGLTDDSFMPGFTHAYLWLAYGAAVGVTQRRRLAHAPQASPQPAA